MKRFFFFNECRGNLLLLAFGLLAIITFACSRTKLEPLENEEGKESDALMLARAAPKVNVRDVGAKGNGTTDDTKAFQKAVDSVAGLGGGTVWVPKGNYLINPDVSVKLKNNVHFYMVDTTAQLIAKPVDTGRYAILLLSKVNNVTITGGKIVGERYGHLRITGEWGMGIAVYGSSNIVIRGTKIINCWGDGITVGEGSGRYETYLPSSYVTVKRVTSDNNRRQGLTIGRSRHITVDSCTFSNTNGTKPMAGIDVEPDTDSTYDVTIQNCNIFQNKGNGIEMNATRGVITNVTAKKNILRGNYFGGWVDSVRNVNMTNNRIFQNIKQSPLIKAIDTVNCVLSPNDNQ